MIYCSVGAQHEAGCVDTQAEISWRNAVSEIASEAYNHSCRHGYTKPGCNFWTSVRQVVSREDSKRGEWNGGTRMDEIRYPIGEFRAITEVTQEQRDAWIRAIEEMSSELRLSVEGLTLEQLSQPYRSGGWTVQQIVHHMADNDMNSYIRFKRALTEEQPTACTYRQDGWANLADYVETPIETSITLMECLHSRFVTILRQLTPSDFARKFTSPAVGEMTLDVALQRYAWHGQHHIAQIVTLRERMGW